MLSVRTIDALQALIPQADDCSDDELLQRYSSSANGAAFTELVRRHGPMVYGTCRRIANNGPDADDAFQATFFVLAQSARSIRSTNAVGSWLHSVAVKVARKAQQQAIKRRTRQMAVARPEAVHPATPMADWWAVVDDELNQLPDILKQVILVCDIGGKSRSKASRELSWPEGTVAKRLARARQELAKRLTRRGVTLSVAALSAGLATEATAAVSSHLRAETCTQAAAPVVGSDLGSVAVRTLAEGVMRSMNASVLRIWAATGLLALLLTGAGMMLAGGPPEPPEKKTAPLQGASEPKAAKADSVEWREKMILEMPGWLPGALAYSSDCKALVVGGSGGKVICYDAATHKEKWTADVGDTFAAVAFSADGKSVLATFKNGVRFLDAATGKPGEAIEEAGVSPDWPVLAVGVFPDQPIDGAKEKLVSHKVVLGTPLGYVVKTWINSAPVSTIKTSTAAKGNKPADNHAAPLAVDPTGSSAIITGPIDRDSGKNVLWAYVAGNYDKDSPGNRLLSGHEAIVVSAAWSKDGKTAVTGDAGGRVLVWDAKTMKETRRLEFGQRVAALAVTADGTQIAAVVIGKQAEYYVWETARSAEKKKPIHADASDFAGTIGASVAFSPDGRQLAGVAYNTAWLARLGELIGKVHVWETTKPKDEAKPPEQPQSADLTWKLKPPITDPQFDIRSVVTSPDGKKFAVETGAKTFVYETASGKKLFTADGRFARFIGGELYAVTDRVNRYDAETGKEKLAAAVLKTRIRLLHAAISPDGRVVAGFDGMDVLLRDAATGLEPVALAGQGKQIRNFADTYPTNEIAWSHDGKRVVGVYVYGEASERGGLAVWDAATGKRLAHLEKAADKPSGRALSFAFSPDDKRLVVGGLTRDERRASSLTLLDAATLKTLQSKPIDSRDGGADVTAVAFSPDGSTVAAAVNLYSGKGPLVRVLLWHPATDEIVHLIPENKTPLIAALAFTPDGKTLIAATGSVIEGLQDKETLHRILIWQGEPKKK